MTSDTRVVGEQPLDRPVTEDVVGDFSGQTIALGQGDALLLREPAADVGEHELAQRGVVHVGVVEPGTQIRDHREVNPVLELGKRVERPLRGLGAAIGESFSEFHYTPLLPSDRRFGGSLCSSRASEA